MNDFGSILKELRSEKGFSQEVFASKIGVHVTNLSKYERNISVPSLEIAKRMAKTLDISLDKLVYGNNKAPSLLTDQELLSLFNKTQNLNSDDVNCVKSLLKAFIFQRKLVEELG